MTKALPSIAVLVAAALLLSACASDEAGPAAAAPTVVAEEEAETGPETEAADGTLVVETGDTVEIHYVGTLDDGSVFDSSRERGSGFSFEVGAAGVITGFHDAVLGLGIGEIRTTRIDPENAYGVRDESLVIEVPFGPSQQDVAVGDQVTLSNGLPAVVLEVREETVLLDANHRLAGQALTFEVEVLSIDRP